MLGLLVYGFNPSRGRQAFEFKTRPVGATQRICLKNEKKQKDELLTPVTIGATASEVRNKILFFLVLGMNLGLCTC